MKILLDENLDHRLRNHLGNHEIFTVSYKGWSGLQNGSLLKVAEEEAFDVLVTGDKSLHLEQKLTGRRIAVIALSSIEWRIIQKHLPRILAAIDHALPSSFQIVHCGRFVRGHSG